MAQLGHPRVQHWAHNSQPNLICLQITLYTHTHITVYTYMHTLATHILPLLRGNAHVNHKAMVALGNRWHHPIQASQVHGIHSTCVVCSVYWVHACSVVRHVRTFLASHGANTVYITGRNNKGQWSGFSHQGSFTQSGINDTHRSHRVIGFWLQGCKTTEM